MKNFFISFEGKKKKWEKSTIRTNLIKINSENKR